MESTFILLSRSQEEKACRATPQQLLEVAPLALARKVDGPQHLRLASAVEQHGVRLVRVHLGLADRRLRSSLRRDRRDQREPWRSELETAWHDRDALCRRVSRRWRGLTA